MTLKAVPFKSVIAELIGFIRGCTNVAQFQELGTGIWNQNAEADYWLKNPNNKGDGDLGRIYGAQWRGWLPADYTFGMPAIDQLQLLVHGLINDPTGRRHIVSAWNPAELDQMALPPCHILFQCFVSSDGYLDLQMYQRSADVFLGVPFNIASYAALLAYLSALTGYRPRFLKMTLGDAHLYEGQIEVAEEMVTRDCRPLPSLVVNADRGDTLGEIEVDDFMLSHYNPHPALRVPMVV